MHRFRSNGRNGNVEKIEVSSEIIFLLYFKTTEIYRSGKRLNLNCISSDSADKCAKRDHVTDFVLLNY